MSDPSDPCDHVGGADEVMALAKRDEFFDCVTRIAKGTEQESAHALVAAQTMLASVNAGEAHEIVNHRGANGMRPVDVIARGHDSVDACHLVISLAEAGADLQAQPSPSQPPAVHMAAVLGHFQVLSTLLDLGADPNQAVNASSMGLLGSTPIHAIAGAYRGAHAEGFGECFASLLAAGADPDAKDRRRQTAIDIAMKAAAATGDRSLVDAMLGYGVQTNGTGQISAVKVAEALSRRLNDSEIVARLAGSQMAMAARGNDDVKELDPTASLRDELPEDEVYSQTLFSRSPGASRPRP